MASAKYLINLVELPAKEQLQEKVKKQTSAAFEGAEWK